MDRHESRSSYTFLRKIRSPFVALFGLILPNSFFQAIATKQIYDGPLKQACVPFLNCHACPTAYMACPIGVLQHFSAIRQFPTFLIGFLAAVGMLFTNSMGIHSIAPSLEIAQYLNYATVLSLKLRYYENKSDNVSLGESDVIIPDGLRSRSVSLQLNREFGVSVLAYLKYRYYTSSLDVQMNTYMVGAVYSF